MIKNLCVARSSRAPTTRAQQNIHQLEASMSHTTGNGVVAIVIACIEVRSIPVANGHDLRPILGL
jgi:hypothetical protein